jgi:phosphatidate cytidylyltransferase
MLKTRIITAILGLPALIGLLLYGPLSFVFSFLLICCSWAVFEMASMLLPRLDEIFRNFNKHDTPYDPSKRLPHYRILALFASFIMGVIFAISTMGGTTATSGFVIFCLMLTITAAVFGTAGIEAEMARVLSYVICLVYAGFPWIVIWMLYKQAPEAAHLLFLLTIVWAGDTGAYFGGVLFGRRKLSPDKSPKKTWEGAISGLAASVLAAWLFNEFYVKISSETFVILVAASCGATMGQMGDLVESVFKRFTRVKDSGTLLPGHGGLMDRVDGVLFAAPVVWFILHWAN